MKKTVLFLVLFCTTTLFANSIPAFESNNPLPTFIDNQITYVAISPTEASVVGNSISTPSIISIPSTVTNGGTTYSVTSIGDNAFYQASLTNITVPNSVTSIGNFAFSNCTGLTSITIPDSIISIGNGAFGYCLGLTSITIPSGVTSIEDQTFLGCTNLMSITLQGNVTSIGNYAFSQCSSLTSITLPNTLTSIGYNAFYQCASLTSITLPNSVTSIGDYVFLSCSNLTSITIPNNVTSIGLAAFAFCYGLTSITLPNSIISIGVGAFYDCPSLTSITLSNGITSIGDFAFYQCSGLTSFTINAVTPPVISSNVFSGVTVGNVYLYVPTASKTAYKNPSLVWSGFKFPPYITAPGSSTARTSSLSMNENSTALTTFTADEAVTWSLGSSNDGALFSINNSGVLVFNAAPDYESTLHSNTYIVQVKATDTNSVTTSQQLTITITDVVVEVLSPNVLSDFNSFTVSANTSDFTINPPTSNSSGAITYTSSNTGVATITGTTVHLVGSGVTTITATQASNGSYLGNSISARMNVNALCGDWGYSLMYPPTTITIIPN